jgi:hypothetical protein
MHLVMLMQLVVTFLPPFTPMQSINKANVEVCQGRVGNLMCRVDRAQGCINAGTRRMSVIHSSLIALNMTGMGNFLKVRNGLCSPLFTWASWVVSSSLTMVFFAYDSPIYLFLSFWPSDHFSFSMSRERGKMKRGPTYYSYMARHLHQVPPPSPAPPPFPGSTSIGFPSIDFPSIAQNWNREDWKQVLIEEEFPLVPPSLLRSPN